MIWNTQPYNFDLANKTLDKFFAKLLEKESDFKLQDIEKEFESKKLFFNEKTQICFKDIHGEIRPVYLFMYRPAYATWQGNISIKYHVFNCEKIQDEIKKNDLQWYARTETNIVDLHPRREHQSFHNVEIQMCGYCSGLLYKTVNDLKLEFKSELVIHNITDEKNIYGYSMEWKRLSREYRQKQNYKCEECGIQILKNEDKQYIHTHHIDSDKSNNNDSNLRCLCILCHSFVDENHKRRFNDNGIKQRTKQEFINKYRSELEGYYTFS
jgi:hypothetical protein